MNNRYRQFNPMRALPRPATALLAGLLFLYPPPRLGAAEHDPKLTAEERRLLDGVKTVRIVTEADYRDVEKDRPVDVRFGWCAERMVRAAGFEVAGGADADAVVRIRFTASPGFVEDVKGAKHWVHADVQGAIVLEVSTYSRSADFRGTTRTPERNIGGARWIEEKRALSPHEAPFDRALCQSGAAEGLAGLMAAAWGSDRATLYGSLFDHGLGVWQVHAGKMLVQVGGEAATNILTAALERELPRYNEGKIHILEALCDVGSETALAAIVRVARDEEADRYLRGECVRLVTKAKHAGRLDPARYREILLGLLESRNFWNVRRPVLTNLEFSGDALAVEPLLQRLERSIAAPAGEDEDARTIRASENEALLSALRGITKQDLGTDPPAWRAWWQANRARLLEGR